MGRHAIHVLLILIIASTAALGRRPQQRGITAVGSQPAATMLQPGSYHALVIGIDNYENLPKLETAVSDANAIAKVLRDQYKFEVNLLTDSDASYQKIVGALSEYAHKLQEKDDLLIYYAGHGMYDKDTDTAYWLPVDAQPDDDVYWIISSVITAHLHAMHARHVLVVSDSCYSGMLTRSVTLPTRQADPAEYLQNMLRGRSRHLMSSGGNEPVADGGSPGHSVFSSAFLRALNGIDERTFTATDLFSMVQRQVAGNSEQVPQYMPIRDSGDVEGDFVFFRSSSAAAESYLPGSKSDVTGTKLKTSSNQQQQSQTQYSGSSQQPKGSGILSASNSPPASMVTTDASAPSFAGKWVELNPKNPENPRNIVLQQNPGQIIFASFRLALNQGVGIWSGPQECAPKFQRTGYDYPSSEKAGTVTLKMSLEGSILVYENDVHWELPCDGHPAGNETQITRYQRDTSETPIDQQQSQAPSGLRVTQVNLYPTPGSYEGQCPIAIHYRGVVVASGPGTVRYTFLRSDNATAPVSTLQFESAGAKEVSDTWQVGGAGRNFELWKSLLILGPGPALESNKAITTLVCQDDGSQPRQALQPDSLPYGRDTCKSGFVWRQTVPDDHVCVTPETRRQAAEDNQEAKARINVYGGRFGPDTCLKGFVWREATLDDHVCVTPETRAQAKADNAQAASRRKIP
jgi:hypothetical protein